MTRKLKGIEKEYKELWSDTMTKTDKWQDEFDELLKPMFVVGSGYFEIHTGVDNTKEIEAIKQFISQVQQDTIQECIEVLEGMEEYPADNDRKRHTNIRLHQAITKLKERL